MVNEYVLIRFTSLSSAFSHRPPLFLLVKTKALRVTADRTKTYK